jgi:hypothetical protein
MLITRTEKLYNKIKFCMLKEIECLCCLYTTPQVLFDKYNIHSYSVDILGRNSCIKTDTTDAQIQHICTELHFKYWKNS